MDRVIIIGCGGSGKSTLSRALSEKTNLPVVHLDRLFWREGWVNIPREEFNILLREELKKDKWIIDGNYASTMELRIKKCDTVVFLDYPLEVCLKGVAERRGKTRTDMPWVEYEEDAEFMEFIKGYEQQSRPQVMALLEQYSDKDIYIFKNRSEAERFLERLCVN